MTGAVDSSGRALLRVQLRHATTAVPVEFDAWIDTGFTGELVLPRSKIVHLALPLGPAVQAVLADGSPVGLDSYLCELKWFDNWKSIEIIANDGQFPLLGIDLLRERELRIDYRAGTLSVD